MKKYIITTLTVATVTLAGCGGMSQQQMEMMESMSSQLNEIQFQVNSNAAAAARAKDMASEALMKASQRGSSKHRMHKKRMMK